MFQVPYTGYHGLLQKQTGYDNVGYDDRPAVYYPKEEVAKEPLYRGTYMDQTTYKSKINYQKKERVPEKTLRAKKEIKLPPPTPTVYGRRYIPLKYRNPNYGKTIEHKNEWQHFSRANQKNKSLTEVQQIMSGKVNPVFER